MRPVTIPEAFWEELDSGCQAELAKFESDGLLVLPTGSRFICPEHATPQSDYDVYLIADENYAADLLFRGWHGPGGEHPGGEYQLNSMSMRFGKLNAIVFFNSAMASRFKDATDFCLSIGGPPDRPTRIKVFKKFFGANKPDFT